MLCAAALSGQEYTYSGETSELELNEQGMYEDYSGDCFVECLLLEKYPDLVESQSKYPEVVGRTEIVETGNLRLSIVPGGNGWAKKRVDENCFSSDPNDCLVKCYVEYPRHLTNVEIVDDSKAVYLTELSTEEIDLLRSANYIVYSQTPCEQEQKELELLYNQFESDDESLSDMVRVYQAKNGLPIGALNLETIYLLGLN